MEDDQCWRKWLDRNSDLITQDDLVLLALHRPQLLPLINSEATTPLGNVVHVARALQRQAEERDRLEAEKIRVTDESNRLEAEKLRVEAEKIRVADKSNRLKAEKIHVADEGNKAAVTIAEKSLDKTRVIAQVIQASSALKPPLGYRVQANCNCEGELTFTVDTHSVNTENKKLGVYIRDNPACSEADVEVALQFELAAEWPDSASGSWSSFVERKATNTEVKVVQPALSSLLETQPSGRLKWVDSHTFQTLPELSPDTVLVPAGTMLYEVKKDPNLVRAFLELKGQNEDLMSVESLGQLCKYLMALLDACPSRERAVGVLSDLHSCHVVIATRHVSDFPYHFRISRPMQLVHRVLVALTQSEDKWLTDSIAALCYNGIPIPIEKRLGSGASARVFLTKVNGEPAAMKVALPDHLVREFNFLRELQGIVGIPELIGMCDDNGGMLIRPVGEKVIRLESSQGPFFISLVCALEWAHSRGILHRDVRPSNFVMAGKDAALVDWGSAVRVLPPAQCVQSPYSGTVMFASDSVLAQLAKGQTEVKVSAQDDLVSLGRSLSYLHYQEDLVRFRMHMGSDSVATYAAKVKQWWSTIPVDSYPLIDTLYTLCMSLDYKGIKECLNRLSNFSNKN